MDVGELVVDRQLFTVEVDAVQDQAKNFAATQAEEEHQNVGGVQGVVDIAECSRKRRAWSALQVVCRRRFLVDLLAFGMTVRPTFFVISSSRMTPSAKTR
ncbi:hypothetical protein AB0O34_27245 [Sphaerisporangium sp. NPDC088356]|uniref:hypothetical protein n=1 Tax=Sphaerisporangium sp. NPDC088356 TaxID=3154871 RepID=UPI003428B6C1